MADKFYSLSPPLPPPPPPPPPTAPPYESPNPHHQTYPIPPPLEPPRTRPRHQDPPAQLSKSERSFQTEKVVTALSAGLFSLLTISLSYVATSSSAHIYHITIAPLVSSTIFLVIAIVSALFLCTTPGRLAKLAIFPIIFATVSGAMIILLNIGSKALSDGGFVSINFRAVHLSAGVFGGLALGTTLSFLLLADGFRDAEL